ncbi:MAG: hypothetical protein WAL56_06495 [Candidatus Sulfotelmatobacter sp.]
MSVSASRIFVSCVIILLLPLSLMAADTGSAIVRGSGGIWVNGMEVADSIAVFPGDSLETKPGFIANLDAEGSSVLIQGESIIKFQGNYLVLEHGSVSVGTSTEFRVHVKCLKVEPLSIERTQYDVTDTTGSVRVTALKNDVRIERAGTIKKPSSQAGSSDSGIVHEGEQATRDESTLCGAAAPEQAGHALNLKWPEIGGGVGGAIVLCLLLCRGTSPENVSPSQP